MAKCLQRIHLDARSKRSAPNSSVTAFAQTQRCGPAEPRQPRDDRIPGERSSRRAPSRRCLWRRSDGPGRGPAEATLPRQTAGRAHRVTGPASGTGPIPAAQSDGAPRDRVCPLPAARLPAAALLLCSLQDSIAWLAPGASSSGWRARGRLARFPRIGGLSCSTSGDLHSKFAGLRVARNVSGSQRPAFVNSRVLGADVYDDKRAKVAARLAAGESQGRREVAARDLLWNQRGNPRSDSRAEPFRSEREHQPTEIGGRARAARPCQ